MEAKSQWPGLRYQQEAEALKFANIKLFGYGAMAWAVVYAGSRFAQRFTGPISFQGTPVLFGLQLATAVSAVILINERLDRQLLPTLCEIEGRSLVLEELCPHYLGDREFYARQIYPSAFDACERYCARHRLPGRTAPNHPAT